MNKLPVIACVAKNLQDHSLDNYWSNKSGPINPELLHQQWQQVIDAAKDLGLNVDEKPSQDEAPEMCLASSAGLVVDDVAILSRFYDEGLAHLSKYFSKWLDDYDVLEPEAHFEGRDAIVVGKDVIIGHGYGSTESAIKEIKKHLKPLKVNGLKLVDQKFRYLDLALGVIDEDTAVYLPVAFDEESQLKLHKLFDNLIALDLKDAECFGACLLSNGQKVYIESGALILKDKLTNQGFQVETLNLSEFRKLGAGKSSLILERYKTN